MAHVVEMERLVAPSVDRACRRVREAQAEWSQQPIASRLAVLRKARQAMALQTAKFCDALSPELARTKADTRVAEVLPLLDACKFLERQAAKILATRKLGWRGRPVWLAGVESEVQRVPFGQILVIGPANYPLFLPGVQALQALAAGNAVVWKPGRGGRGVAEIFAAAMYHAGLPRELLVITEETVAAARDALAGQINGVAPDKVVFTGSMGAGREVLQSAAETITPCVAELSGCDAVVVLPSADLDRVVKAMAFGMRLNGSATCMAPRRLVLVGASPARSEELVSSLLTAFGAIDGVLFPETVGRPLDALLEDAMRQGARLRGGRHEEQQPILVTNVSPAMKIAQSDVFAPLLMMMSAQTADEAAEMIGRCPYALTVSIFGDERAARAVAVNLTAGTVVINDVIVPTADARVPFGGHKQSGFGATRGAEGLLEMTAAKTIAVRRGRNTRHYEATGPAHEDLFDGLILAAHAGTWAERWNGWKRMVAAARTMKK